jgi:hypothetical protein
MFITGLLCVVYVCLLLEAGALKSRSGMSVIILLFIVLVQKQNGADALYTVRAK